nr:Protein of uncharacterised function (DUF1469) [Streptococcus thermophilus]
MYTSGSTSYKAKIDSIPLRDTDVTQPGADSLGALVSNATEQVSSLVRSEIELAKTEVVGEAKKAAIGSGMLVAAGVIALFSTFFFFFFLAKLIAIWTNDAWGFGIVFLLMLITAGILALVGVKRFQAMKKPEKTIQSVNELKGLVPGQAQKNLEKDSSELYTSYGTGTTVPAGYPTAQGNGSTKVTK